MTALTVKQESFCRVYLETGNASEAYRQSYEASGMQPATINRAAKEMIDTPKIAARLTELREPVMKRHAITVDTLLNELEEARTMALACDTPQTSAAVTATMGKAKLLGLDKQIVELSGKDGGAIQVADVSPEALKEELARLGFGRESAQLGSKLHESD